MSEIDVMDRNRVRIARQLQEDYLLDREDAMLMADILMGLMFMKPRIDMDEWADAYGEAAARGKASRLGGAHRLLERAARIYMQELTGGQREGVRKES